MKNWFSRLMRPHSWLAAILICASLSVSAFSFIVPTAFASVATVVDMVNLPNGMAAGSPISPGSFRPSSILRFGVTPSSAGTLTSVRVNFSGTGFTTSDLRSVLGGTSSTYGVVLMRDGGTLGSSGPGDTYVEYTSTTDWSPASTSIIVTPSSTVNLSSGVTQYFFVLVFADNSISNGDQIIASIPTNGVVTSQGSGPATTFTSNAYTADTIAPSIVSFEGTLGSPTTTVRFSEPVLSIDESSLSSGEGSLVYVHGGGSQTLSNIIHMLGQDIAAIILSDTVAVGDLDITPATIAAGEMKVVDLAGNIMATTTLGLSSPVRITTPNIPAATVGTAYTDGSPLTTFSGSGGAAPYTYAIADESTSSTLSGMGIRLTSAGKIVGTPTTAGSYSFPARIIDAGVVSSVRVYTLNVASVGGLIPGLTSVSPGGGPQSGSVTVNVVGSNTSFSGSSAVDMLMPIGAPGTNGVTISGVTVANATHLSFTASIAGGAATGARDLRISTGGQVVTLPNAFSVFAGGGSGLQLLLPVNDATGVQIPPVFSFSQSSHPDALSYRVKIKTVFEVSDSTPPIWDYTFTKTSSESSSHCGSTQCNVRYGVGDYRIITPPTSLTANTDYYWQILSYATSVGAVANSVAPLESTAPRHFRTTDSVTDTVPPGIMHRPVFRARESSALNLYAKVFDNIATQSTSPALSVKVFYCQGLGCSSMSEATCTGVGAGFYYCSIPSSVAGIGVAGTITRYYLRANDGSNTSYSRQADGTPFQLTAAAVGVGTISGTVLDSNGDCAVSVRGARVIADGTSYSAQTDASCAFSIGDLPSGSYDLIAFADGYGERRSEGVSIGTAGLPLRLMSGAVGGVGGDTTRPAVRMTCPFNGSRNMPGGDSNFKVCVGFSKAMNQTTIGAAGNLTVRELNPLTGSSVDITSTKGAWVYYSTAPGLPGVPNESNIAVWSFSGSNTFGDDKSIAVVVGSEVTDVSGNAIQGNQSDGSYAMSFTTGRAFSELDGFSGGAFGSGAFIPPRVVGSTPAPGAFGIPLNTRVIVNFSEAMADDSGSYFLRNCLKVFPTSDLGETSTVISASLDASKRIATVVVPSLTASAQYRIKVLGSCRASSGLTLAPPGESASVMYAADFRAGTTSDVTAPTITGSFPNTGATNVSVGSGVVGVSFSLDIDPSTITTETVYLSVGSTRVNGTVEYRPLERRAVFSPRTALSSETTYTLNVTTDVTALNGTALSTAVARTFTTGVADTVTPQIRYMNADDHAISITFSESMNAASLLDAVNWPRSVLNPDVYDVIKYGVSGFNAGSAGTVVALTGGRLSYDPIENTVLIEGLNLAAASGQELYLSLDVAGPNVAKDVSGNTMNTSFANTRTPVKASSATGGALGPGAMNTNAFAAGGFTPTNISGSTFSTFGQVEARPSVPGTSATSKYFLRIPLSRQIPSGGKVVLTFPSGFSALNAKQDVMSPSRQDVNGPGTGTVTFKCETPVAGGKSCGGGAANSDDASSAQGGLADDGVVVSDRTVTIYLNGATNVAGYDFLMLDIDGITNSSVPLDFSTSGYTVDIKTFNGTTLLESMTSRPFYLQSIGSNTLGGTLTMTGNDQDCNVNVYLNSPTGGTQTAVAAFSGGLATASYAFTNVATGDAFISTDRAITCGSGGSAKEFVGQNIQNRVTVSGATTHNFSLSSATTGGVAVTVRIVGAPNGERLDVFGGSQSNFVVRQVTISSDPQDVTLRLPDGFQGFVGVGPQVQPGVSGPPVAPSYVLPRPKEVKVAGTGCTVDGAIGCTVSITLTNASKFIKGIVKDGSGRLMANVEVFAYSPGGFGTRGQTSSDGTFSLAVIEGTYTVGANVQGVQSNEVPIRVSADSTDYLFINGATTGISAASALSANILKIAKPECTIGGRVTDGTNVVQSAGVSARRTDGQGFSNAMTDSSGSYTLYVGCTGTWQVQAFNPGYGMMTAQSVVMAGTSQSGISFSPTLVGTFYTVSGTVTIGGTGVQGAIVRVQNATNANEAVTDATGAYSVRVPAGTYTARAFIPGSGDTPPIAAFVVSSDDSGNDIVVGASNSITFVFSGSVSDGFLDLVSSDGRSSHADIHGGVTSTLSLPDGIYEVRIGMPGIQIGRSAIAGRAGTAYVGGTGLLTVNGNEVLDVTLPTLRTITGTVTDGSVNIPDAWVDMMETATGRALGTKTDGSGAFTLSVPDGTYKINAMKPGYLGAATALVVSGNMSGQTLTVSTASLTISGQVLVGGTGVANAFVRGERQGGGFSASQTDAAGNYSLSVTGGNWRVIAVANGYQEKAFSGQIEVGSSAVTGKNITLSTASSYSVAEPASQPISTSNGGTIEDTDAGIRLVVGPNALTTDGSNAIISSTQTTNVPVTPGARPLPGFEFSAQGEDGNAINNFNDAITIEMSYTPAELATQTAADGSTIDTIAEANALQMASYDPTTSAWDLQATTRTCEDADGNSISDPVSLSECTTFVISSIAEHFSLYAPVIPTDPSAPTTPDGFAAAANGTSAISLSWTQVAGAGSYDIYRSTTSDGTYARLGGEPTVSSGATVTYSDTTILAGTTYYYKISALDGSSESAASAAISARINISGGGALGASSGGGSSSPLTYTPVSPVVPVVTAVPVAPITVVAPTVIAPISTPVVPVIVAPQAFDGTIVTIGGSLKYLYGYTNTTKKTQAIRVTREIFNSAGKSMKRSNASANLRAGARWEAKVSETLPKTWKAGDYRSVATIKDTKGKVLYTTTLNIRIQDAISIPIPNPITSTIISSEAPTTGTLTKVAEVLKGYGITGTDIVLDRIGRFIENGTTQATIQLGVGERLAVYKDAVETMDRSDVSDDDLAALAEGRIPKVRNLAKEKAQAARALTTFKTVYGHAPNFNDSEENLFWNTLMYRIRFPRDLAREKNGISAFKRLFNRSPEDSFQWSVVRGLGYVGTP